MDDTNKPERIAHRSTRGEGRFAKKRWTEISAYYLHNPPLGGHRFVVETKGCSSVPGEGDRTTRFAAATLALALARLDDGRGLSGPARSVIEQAQAWADRASVPIAPPTYTDAQRDAAIKAILDLPPARAGDTERDCASLCVDAVAAVLGLVRETPRG